jgi:hypothetical protein
VQFTRRAFFAIALVAAIGFSGAFFYHTVPSQAVQQPRVSLDMVASDDPTTAAVEVANTYLPSVDNDFDGLPDPGSNVMSVGSIENCSIHDEAGNNAAHLHGFPVAGDPRVQLVVQNVEDMLGWQARINMDGTKIGITSPAQVDYTPFADGTVDIAFPNLPVDPDNFAHKALFGAPVDIQNPDAPNHTVLMGSSALGNETAGETADTPSKATHDETVRTYDAPTGGVLAQIQYVVKANQVGEPSLALDLDDDDPTTPGSLVAIFISTGVVEGIDLTPADLGDGFHGEGATCDPPQIDITNHTFTNDTPLPADGLNIRFSGAVTPRLIQNAPGCGGVAISGDHAAGRVDLAWSTLCVDSGETVIIEITSWPQAQVSCSNWSILGLRLFGDCDAAP